MGVWLPLRQLVSRTPRPARRRWGKGKERKRQPAPPPPPLFDVHHDFSQLEELIDSLSSTEEREERAETAPASHGEVGLEEHHNVAVSEVEMDSSEERERARAMPGEVVHHNMTVSEEVVVAMDSSEAKESDSHARTTPGEVEHHNVAVSEEVVVAMELSEVKDLTESDARVRALPGEEGLQSVTVSGGAVVSVDTSDDQVYTESGTLSVYASDAEYDLDGSQSASPPRETLASNYSVLGTDNTTGNGMGLSSGQLNVTDLSKSPTQCGSVAIEPQSSIPQGIELLSSAQEPGCTAQQVVESVEPALQVPPLVVDSERGQPESESAPLSTRSSSLYIVLCIAMTCIL